jgi:hypothetical protein
MIRAVRQWWPVLAVLALAAALQVALGPGYAGYDASWSLVWGRELAGLDLPSYAAPLAPTPHPLANAVAAILSPLPDGGERALVALTFLSFAALVAGALALSMRLAWWPAGVAAALVLVTRGILDREVAFASFDLPFLALVLWAAAAEASRPRRGAPVLGLLALAGLLRPEAWLLSLVYLGWLALAPVPGGRDLRGAIALTLAAPLLWVLSDLVVTGDPLHSLTATRHLAADLDRPTGLSTALHAVPSSLASLMGTLPFAASLLGLVAGLLLAPRRLAIPLAAICCGIVTFLVIGAAGLPVLVRYLLIPVTMLAVAAAIGLALPWLMPAGRRRATAAGVSAAIALLLVASLPESIDGVRAARSFTLARGDVHRDLRAIVDGRAFRAAAARCPQIHVPDFRSRPVLLADGSIDPARVVVGNLPDGQPGLLLTYATQQALLTFNLGAPGEARLQAVPAGSRRVARNDSWLAAAVC